MSVTLTVDAARRRIIATLSGTVTLEDLMEIVSRQDALDRWGDAVLIDATAANSLTLHAPEIDRLIAEVARHARGRTRGPVAVAATQDVLFGMTRMYQIKLGSRPFAIEVFRSVAEAERWIEAVQGSKPEQEED